jgi:hypothetical protein
LTYPGHAETRRRLSQSRKDAKKTLNHWFKKTSDDFALLCGLASLRENFCRFEIF